MVCIQIKHYANLVQLSIRPHDCMKKLAKQASDSHSHLYTMTYFAFRNVGPKDTLLSRPWILQAIMPYNAFNKFVKVNLTTSQFSCLYYSNWKTVPAPHSSGGQKPFIFQCKFIHDRFGPICCCKPGNCIHLYTIPCTNVHLSLAISFKNMIFNFKLKLTAIY